MSQPRFNRFQVPKSAATDASSHVLGESTRRGVLSEGDGTSMGDYGGNAMKKKDRRFGGANAPDKQLFSGEISFGQTGLTGRS